MPLPEKLNKLTAAAWKEAKKEAGVKGAGFFDGRSGRAVGDKITDYHAKTAAFDATDDTASGQAALKAVRELCAALTTAKKDRDFSGDTAKLFKTAMDKLVADAGSAEEQILVQLKRIAESAAKPASGASKQQQLIAELKAAKKFGDVMKQPVLRKAFEEYCTRAHVRENYDFMMAVAAKTPREKIIAQFIDCGEKTRINIPEGAIDEIHAGGDLKKAVSEVNDMLTGCLQDFRAELLKKLQAA